MFKSPYSFTGRIRRTEFGITLLIQIIYYIVINAVILSNYSAQVVPALGDLFIYLVALSPVLLLTVAQGAKRCHDTGISGWFQLIPGFYVYLLIKAGEKGNNQYGEDPQNFIR